MDRPDEIKNNKLQCRDKAQKPSYEKRKVCPDCGGSMVYIYGEMYECPDCGCRALSDFGKVRKYLEDNGPRTAFAISDATGVDLDVIQGFLREGRIEIPDGSEQYIKCQKCGAEIRYGRYCPDCIRKLTNNISNAAWAPEMGEKPKKKYKDGKMHFLSEEKMHRK